MPGASGGSSASKTVSRSDAAPAPGVIGAPPSDTASNRQAASDADPARGRAIVASGAHGCAACHTIPGIRSPRGIVGPPLGGMAQRGFIAGQLPNRPEVLVAFLQNPPALIPKTGMPDVGLSPQQARDIAAFLYTLEPSVAR